MFPAYQDAMLFNDMHVNMSCRLSQIDIMRHTNGAVSWAIIRKLISAFHIQCQTNCTYCTELQKGSCERLQLFLWFTYLYQRFCNLSWLTIVLFVASSMFSFKCVCILLCLKYFVVCGYYKCLLLCSLLLKIYVLMYSRIVIGLSPSTMHKFIVINVMQNKEDMCHNFFQICC